MVFQAVAQRAVAAHRQAADEGILALAGEGEHAAGQLDKLLTDKLAVILAGAGAVKVERVVAGRHDDAEVVVSGVALQTGAGHPVHCAADDAVQQVECGELLLRRQGVVEVRHFVGGQHDRDGHGTHQTAGKNRHLDKSHGGEPPCKYMN